MSHEFIPGDRILVFDHRLFKDDVSTPLSVTMQPATIVRRYGKKYKLPRSEYCRCEAILRENCTCEPKYWLYKNLVDVIFDSNPNEERQGFFTYGIKLL